MSVVARRRSPRGVYPPEVRRLAVELYRAGRNDGEIRREVYARTGYTISAGCAARWAG